MDIVNSKTNLDQILREINLTISKDRMLILLDCDVPEGDITPILDTVYQKLRTLGIEDPPRSAVLQKRILEAAEKSRRLRRMVLIRGQKMIPPVNSKVEWTADFFNTGFVIDRVTGAIDYRKRSAKVSVVKGQLLGTVYPAEMGKDGQDVFGERMIAENPKEVKYSGGSGVRFESAENRFYALLDGRIRKNETVITVDPIYVVEGDVDMISGDISHNGTVIVKGDICGGATVESTGDIDVGGVVEDAEIITEGNLTVNGGITQADDLSISIGGSLHAKFILDSRFRVEGDIVIEREIVNSTLRTRGSIIMPRGRIVGGEISALRGITIGQAGTRASVPTVLITGEDYALPGRQLGIRKKIREAEKKRIDIKSTVEALLPCQMSMNPDEKVELQQMIDEVKSLEDSITVLENEIAHMQSNSRKLARNQVSIQSAVFSDTIICLGNDKMIIKEERSGPIRAILEDGVVQLV